ncbi:MAG: tetratricopeptide (TPR) repeat protein [Planctomycetota bacterium]
MQIGQEALVRFQREGIAAGKFNHPGAIQIFDFDVEGKDTWYLAMEYVEGRTLKQYLLDKGALDAPDAMDLVAQILSVLAEAHRQGIVHRDLKPENIMISTSATEEATVKVLDFGLSKLLDQPENSGMMTQTGRIMGTPMYMSPEQCSGREVDHRSDLYSAGLILFELLTGSTPFQAENLTELLVKHLNEEAPSLYASNPDLMIPAGMEGFLEQALAKNPDQRFASATQMLDALEDVDLERMGKARRTSLGRTGFGKTAMGHAVAEAGSSKTKLAAGVIGLLLLAAGSVWYFSGPGPRPELARLSLQDAELLTNEESHYLGLLAETRRSLRNRELEVALVRIGDALALPCRDSEAYLLRAFVYSAKGDLDTAQADYLEALVLDPNYVEAHCALGWIALERDDISAATEQFEQAVAVNADSPHALAGSGALNFEEGDFAAAAEQLQRACAMGLPLPRGQEYLGRTLLALEDYDAAVAAFTQAKREDARSWRSYAGLGEAYLALERTEDAEAQWLEAISLRPGAWELERSLASMLVNLGRHADAKEHVEAGLTRQPKDGQLHILKALVAAEADEPAETVIEYLEAGVGFGAADTSLHQLLGLQLMKLGRNTDAIRQFRAAIALDDTNANAHKDLGLALAAGFQYVDAATELERAAQLQPDDGYLRLSLGILYMDFIGGDAKALDHLKAYTALGGDDSRVPGWIARLEG